MGSSPLQESLKLDEFYLSLALNTGPEAPSEPLTAALFQPQIQTVSGNHTPCLSHTPHLSPHTDFSGSY